MRKLHISFVVFLCWMTNIMAQPDQSDKRPNIMWIFIEDASSQIGCYGEKAIETPNIDALASDGLLFENAFVTAPVCSASRSALVTGMYQTTTGMLNHRSQVNKGKGGGNENYYHSFQMDNDIPLASKLFEKAGYYTTNETINGEVGKQDYNFIAEDIYSGKSWKDAPVGTPFFTQIQLHGGKNRSRTADTEDFQLPPYYFEDDVMRQDWKEYLGSWLDTDEELGQIVADLKQKGVYDNTLIFFLTDHGISHLRGKQFLYDEGIRVPLIVKIPNNKSGTIRKDMVLQIDLLPTSLAYASLPIPKVIQGKDIFGSGYEEREYLFTARDRCDETTDIIRSIRTKKFKYIRNFLSHRSKSQRNQYKDTKLISIHTKMLFDAGQLNELQAKMYNPTRPTEELYDLENDPFEVNNLASNPEYQSIVTDLRSVLYQWMSDSNDPGLIPEPYLEELGLIYGNKYIALKQPIYQDMNERLIDVIEAGENKDYTTLLDALNSNEPSVRYWAVTWLGVNKFVSAMTDVRELTTDKDASVRIAANLALYRIDSNYYPISALASEVNHPNLIVGMYAMNAIEQTGIRDQSVKEVAELATKSKYEFTRRFGKYLQIECINTNE